MLSEFSLIEKYFSKKDQGDGIVLGVGDDCALLSKDSEYELAVTTDTQNEGIHFFKGTDPYLLGYKSLLVNVSDLAAMGAKPYAFTLSISLPEAQDSFLEPFSRGLMELASALHLALIGGNTTKGPLSITISAYGLVKKGQAMLRSGARVGDEIYVTGSLGLPGLLVDLGYETSELAAMLHKAGCRDSLRTLFEKLYPKSMLIANRCAFATSLSKYCRCAIDISDGLVGDLGHILSASGVGAEIWVENLPRPQEFLELGLEESYQERLCLFGGGDYELLFCVPKEHRAQVKQLSFEHNVALSLVGAIKNDVFTIIKCGKVVEYSDKAFEHF